MSETFLIKKSAHDDSNPDATDGTGASTKFIIGPGEINGIGGINENSDLKFYGFGTVQWGEGVNQNAFRILENNACPQKDDGDYNPATGLNDYDTATDPILPKDRQDLGTGNGINVPNLGQTWFNTSDEELYMYVSATGLPSIIGWQLITETTTVDAGNALQDHIDNDLVHLTTLQNTYLDLLSLPTLTADDTNQLIGIDSNVQDQLNNLVANKVNRLGNDSVSGQLSVGSLFVTDAGINPQFGVFLEKNNNMFLTKGDITLFDGVINIGGVGIHSITTTDSNKLPTDPGYEEEGNDFNIRIGHTWDASLSPTAGETYTTIDGAVLISANNKITPTQLSIKLAPLAGTGNSGATITWGASFDFLLDGNIKTSGPSQRRGNGPDGTVDNPSYLTTGDYVEDGYLPRVGGTMGNNSFIELPGNAVIKFSNSGSRIEFGSGGTVQGLAEPLNNQTSFATPKSYVDAKLLLKADLYAPILQGDINTNNVPTTIAPKPVGAPPQQIATVGYVDALADQTAEAVNIANSLANSFTIRPATFNIGNDPRAGLDSYYNYYENVSGITGRNTWRNMYYLDFTSNNYNSFFISRSASARPLAYVTNETSNNTMRWTGSVYVRLATDDNGQVRFAAVPVGGGTTVYSTTVFHARTTARSYTMTWTFLIPAGKMYNIHFQGQLTSGWNFDAIYLHRINSNSIVFE